MHQSGRRKIHFRLLPEHEITLNKKTCLQFASRFLYGETFLLLAERINERKAYALKLLPLVFASFIGAVKQVADHRVADVRAVHSYLMRATCKKRTFTQSVAFIGLRQHLKVRF